LALALASGLPAAAFPADAGIEAVRARLAHALPQIPLATLRPARALPGWYELEMGPRLVYVSPDGSRLVAGEVFDVTRGENLTEAWRRERALALIEAVGEENMIVLGAADGARTITVFTDVDCPYCARLHRDVPELARAGIRVRYLLYPRAGLDSRTYRRSVAVWCADDRVRAVGAAKAGEALEPRTCPNPVARHYRLGRRLGIQGTPTIYLDDGSVIGGYVPPERLRVLLERAEPARAARGR
jgi:thiol:disulfide interchange protein DsbC